jgi:hypothetical protein
MSSAVAVLFGLHLTVIAGLNATLWWLVMRGFGYQLIAALFPLAVWRRWPRNMRPISGSWRLAAF